MMSEEIENLGAENEKILPSEAAKVESETYKCPSCGNFLKFDPAAQKLKCEYCGTERDIEPKPAQELFYTALSEQGYSEWGAVKSYKCPECGAMTLLEKYETTTVCPFCGAPNILERDELPGLKPNAVLPFKVPQEEAKTCFRKWLKKKWLAPFALKKEAKITKMRGVYIPIWTFDSNVSANYEARLGKTYTTTVGSGKNRRTVTRVRWFNVSGSIGSSYNDIQVEASQYIDPSALKKMSGFDTVNAVGYDDDYLAGFSAERYSLGLDSGWESAQQTIVSDLKRQIRARYPQADRVDYINVYPIYSGTTYKYVLSPVWVNSYRYRKKMYGCVVNGRNGNSVGKAPVSPVKASLLGIVIAAAVAAIGYLIYLYMF